MKTTLKLFCAIVLTFAQASLGLAQTQQVQPLVVNLELRNSSVNTNTLTQKLSNEFGEGVEVTGWGGQRALIRLALDFGEFDARDFRTKNPGAWKQAFGTGVSVFINQTGQSIAQHAGRVGGPIGSATAGAAQAGANQASQDAYKNIAYNRSRTANASLRYTFCYRQCLPEAKVVFRIQQDNETQTGWSRWVLLAYGTDKQQYPLPGGEPRLLYEGGGDLTRADKLQETVFDLLLAEAKSGQMHLIGSSQFAQFMQDVEDARPKAARPRTAIEPGEQARTGSNEPERITEAEWQARQRIKDALSGNSGGQKTGAVRQVRVPVYDPNGSNVIRQAAPATDGEKPPCDDPSWSKSRGWYCPEQATAPAKPANPTIASGANVMRGYAVGFSPFASKRVLNYTEGVAKMRGPDVLAALSLMVNDGTMPCDKQSAPVWGPRASGQMEADKGWPAYERKHAGEPGITVDGVFNDFDHFQNVPSGQLRLRPECFMPLPIAAPAKKK